MVNVWPCSVSKGEGKSLFRFLFWVPKTFPTTSDELFTDLAQALQRGNGGHGASPSAVLMGGDPRAPP